MLAISTNKTATAVRISHPVISAAMTPGLEVHDQVLLDGQGPVPPGTTTGGNAQIEDSRRDELEVEGVPVHELPPGRFPVLLREPVIMGKLDLQLGMVFKEVAGEVKGQIVGTVTKRQEPASDDGSKTLDLDG